MNTITPAAAQDLLANGVTLVDIRSADEYAREHIAGAQRLDVAAAASGTVHRAGHLSLPSGTAYPAASRTTARQRARRRGGVSA